MRRIALCILIPTSLALTAMCCVSAWHNYWHPKIRPDRIDSAGIRTEEFQRDLWLFAATQLRGSDRIWGGVGWNRRNLVALCVVAQEIEGDELPDGYWPGMKHSTNRLFHSKLRTRQNATLRFETSGYIRLADYWFFIPLWLAWLVVSPYPIFVVSKAILLPRLRRRRGQCEGCGYNLSGNVSGVCPECGKKLRGSIKNDDDKAVKEKT